MRKLLLAAAAAVGLAAPASALVQYDFTAYSSFDFDSEMFSGSFTYVAPDFVVPPTDVAVGDLLSCSAFSSLGPATCGGQQFLSGYADNTVTVSFGINGVVGTWGVFYYFDALAFSAPGTYQTVLFGTNQAGQLVVTDLDGTVPEPASWAMMITGFGLVGGAMRRRVAQAA